MSTTELEPETPATIESGLGAPQAEINDDLARHTAERDALRRRMDKTQFRAARSDLAEGVRGLIRTAPFTAMLVAVGFGMMLNRSRMKNRRRV